MHRLKTPFPIMSSHHLNVEKMRIFWTEGFRLVMCKPGPAQKPRLGLGLRGLRPSQTIGRAGALNAGGLRLGSGSSPGFSHIEHIVCRQCLHECECRVKGRVCAHCRQRLQECKYRVKAQARVLSERECVCTL